MQEAHLHNGDDHESSGLDDGVYDSSSPRAFVG